MNRILKHLKDASKEEESKVIVTNDGLELTVKDLRTVRGSEWLNDVAINAYIDIVCRHYSLATRTSITHIDPVIFCAILKSGVTSPLAKSVVAQTNMFDYDLVIVPVFKPAHWCLSTVHLNEKRITYYDSLGGCQANCCDTLLDLLSACHEHYYGKQLKRDKWKCVDTYMHKEVPRQKNLNDCGAFVCAYAEYISAGHALEFKQSDMGQFRRKIIISLITNSIIKPLPSVAVLTSERIPVASKENRKTRGKVSQRTANQEKPADSNLLAVTSAPQSSSSPPRLAGKRAVKIFLGESGEKSERPAFTNVVLLLRLDNQSKPTFPKSIDLTQLVIGKDVTTNQPVPEIGLPKAEELRIVHHNTSRRGVKFDIVFPNSTKISESVEDSYVVTIDELVLFKYIYILSVKKPRVWEYMRNRSSVVRDVMLKGLKKDWHRE